MIPNIADLNNYLWAIVPGSIILTMLAVRMSANRVIRAMDDVKERHGKPPVFHCDPITTMTCDEAFQTQQYYGTKGTFTTSSPSAKAEPINHTAPVPKGPGVLARLAAFAVTAMPSFGIVAGTTVAGLAWSDMPSDKSDGRGALVDAGNMSDDKKIELAKLRAEYVKNLGEKNDARVFPKWADGAALAFGIATAMVGLGVQLRRWNESL